MCQFVGLWPDKSRNQVADWLFSMEEDANGKPKGIGLSLWRFNIGAGSAAQNNISDDWRKTEGFLQDDMTYDWSRQAGQKWFMQAAKERGVASSLVLPIVLPYSSQKMVKHIPATEKKPTSQKELFAFLKISGGCFEAI